MIDDYELVIIKKTGFFISHYHSGCSLAHVFVVVFAGIR